MQVPEVGQHPNLNSPLTEIVQTVGDDTNRQWHDWRAAHEVAGTRINELKALSRNGGSIEAPGLEPSNPFLLTDVKQHHSASPGIGS
jgi:hypothetical protein